ncbi:MAG TPA: YqaE/Pmp3 family membrane protein [Chitinophagaceae bacterium]|nr:YqaE/Pmp3 family membrane protein [Chitinophagaceae bacterium]
MQRMFTRFLFGFIAILMLSTSAFAVSLPVPVSTEPDPATVKAAVGSFNALSKREKRERVKEVKKYLKHVKAAKRAGQEPSDNTILLVILALLLPPLAVYLHEGEINSKFWIDLVLTLLFFVPGVIYALIVVLGKA